MAKDSDDSTHDTADEGNESEAVSGSIIDLPIEEEFLACGIRIRQLEQFFQSLAKYSLPEASHAHDHIIPSD